jgi:hypothetical protein
MGVTARRVCQCLGCCDAAPGETDAGVDTCMSDLNRPVYTQAQLSDIVKAKKHPERGTLQPKAPP